MPDRGTWKLTVGGSDLATYEDVLTGLAAGGGPTVQTEELAFGLVPFRAERGNSVVELQFVLTKEHADNAAAADWFMTGALTFNGVKDVTLTHKDHGGNETSWTMEDAEVRVTTDDPVGVTTVSRVSIAGYPVEDEP